MNTEENQTDGEKHHQNELHNEKLATGTVVETEQAAPAEPMVEPTGEMPFVPAIAGDEEILPTPPPAEQGKLRPNACLWALLGVAGLLVVIYLVAQALGLPGRLSGVTDNAAAAIPADAQVYLGANLLQLRPDKLDRLVQPYMAQIEDPPFGTGNGLLIELEKQYLKPLDIVFATDVQPWIGQYFGMGISCGDDLESAIDLEECDVTFVVEALNSIAADAFIQKWAQPPAGRSAQVVRQQDYQGVMIYIVPEKDMAIAYSKGLVIFAHRLEAVQAAIDAQAGQSIQDVEAFQQLSRQLPGGRFLTLFTNQPTRQIMPWISGSGGGLLENSLSNTLPIQAIAAGLSIVDEGLQIDAITSYDPEKLTEAQRTRLQNASQASRIAQLMPADTILLYTAQEIQGAVQAIPEALADRSNEALLLSTLLGEIGFELEPDILSYLNKEYGLAVVPETGGALAQAEFPVGVLFASHITDHAMLDASIRQNGLSTTAMETTISDLGNGHVYQINRPVDEQQLYISLSQEYLAVGSSRPLVEAILSPGETLSEDLKYKEVWTHFMTGTTPILYLNLSSLLNVLEKGQGEFDSLPQAIQYLTPIHHLAIGAMPFKDNQVHTTAIMFVEN